MAGYEDVIKGLTKNRIHKVTVSQQAADSKSTIFMISSPAKRHKLTVFMLENVYKRSGNMLHTQLNNILGNL